MRSIVAALLILATSLSTKAQNSITLATYPPKVIELPYDSAVIMPVTKYRDIRSLVHDAPEIVDSLQSVILEMQSLNSMGEMIGGSLQSENEWLYGVLDVKDEEIWELTQLNKDLREIAQNPPKQSFGDRAKSWVLPAGVGLVIGILVAK